MFKIEDGREHFYQWDLDRRLIIDDPMIKEVHFCNRTDNCSLVCETYTENGLTLVNVPNILLQSDWKIRVYAMYAINGKHTRYDACFEVKSRTKPSDYIYTDEELKTWEELENRIIELEENSGDSDCQIKFIDLGYLDWEDVAGYGLPSPKFFCDYPFGTYLIAWDDGMCPQYGFLFRDDYDATDNLRMLLPNGKAYWTCYGYDYDENDEWVLIYEDWVPQNYGAGEIDYKFRQVPTTSQMTKQIQASQDYLTKYVDDELAAFDFIKIVDYLPDVGLPNRIYLVPKNDGDSMDLFDEFIWLSQIDDWEYISTKQVQIDLTDYVQKSSFDFDTETQTLTINI